MYLELKKEIIEWLLENRYEFNRVIECTEHFREYIYNSKGNYLIGGENVAKFIREADNLIYKREEE